MRRSPQAKFMVSADRRFGQGTNSAPKYQGSRYRGGRVSAVATASL
jgi:hypothetical protein